MIPRHPYGIDPAAGWGTELPGPDFAQNKTNDALRTFRNQEKLAVPVAAVEFQQRDQGDL